MNTEYVVQTMPRFLIEQTTTAVILFDGQSRDEQHALDLMAQEAGYADFASIPEEIGGRETLQVRLDREATS